jgi:hypothetical protein
MSFLPVYLKGEKVDVYDMTNINSRRLLLYGRDNLTIKTHAEAVPAEG